jgi:hypothetical protein
MLILWVGKGLLSGLDKVEKGLNYIHKERECVKEGFEFLLLHPFQMSSKG